MKQPTIKILISLLILISITACDSDKKDTKPHNRAKTPIITQTTMADNTAMIAINNKRYSLPVRLCNKPSTRNFKGQSITHYSVLAQQSPTGSKQISFPIFSISGVTGDKGNISNYKLELSNNGQKVVYSGKAPYDIFDGKTLHYKGQTKEGKKTVSIEITINCT